MSKEALARIKINKFLEDAGWRFFDNEKGKANIQLEQNVKITQEAIDALGQNFEKTKNGFTDYILLDEYDRPIVVLEAKKEEIHPLTAKEQARSYANSLRAKYVILSNGNIHYFWNLEKGNPEMITTFPTYESLITSKALTSSIETIAEMQIDKYFVALSQDPGLEQSSVWKTGDDELIKKYCIDNNLRILRYYQENAIKAVQNSIKEGNTRFLLEMATGTGKTLVSAGIIKLFIRSDIAHRVLFLVDRLELENQARTNFVKYLGKDGIRVADEIGYPVLVRPSYVLGGRAMQIVSNKKALEKYLKTAVEINKKQPVLVDKYIVGKELEVDAVCDGKDVFIPGIMELVEKTGIHSGDSISVYPTFSVSDKVKKEIIDYTVKLGLGLGMVGLYNIQFIVDKEEKLYVIEVNPRSSRSVPFISKSTGYSLADIGTLVMLGKSLKEQGITEVYPKEKERWYVKAPAFSFSKLLGLDACLSPEMKSTGEAIGYDKELTRALYKALQSSGVKLANYGTVFVTVSDRDKEEVLPLIRRFYNLGFNIEATKGTAEFLKENGIRTRVKKKISEGSNEILDAIRKGYIKYVINTRNIDDTDEETDGSLIRRCASENNITMFTSLDTVRALLNVIEDMTFRVSTIDAE